MERARSGARVRIGRIWVDAVTFAEALDRIEALVDARAGGKVFTPNVDHVVNAETDAEFREVYRSADLSLVDGQPLVWASHLLGAPLPEKISGSDLVMPLMQRAGARGWRVFLLGAGPGAAPLAAEVLRRRFGVNIVGTDAPILGRNADPARDAATVERIRSTRPDLVLVAFGAPKQELWIHRNAEALAPAVALGIGAAVDFVAGRVKRAPRWVSRAGLEWLFRLAAEPRRLWRRYLVNDSQFVFILLRGLRESRTGRAAALER